MRAHEILDRHGNVVVGATIIPDGGRLRRIGMFAMDNRTVGTARVTDGKTIGHRPGALPVSDVDRAKRVALRQAADAKLSTRWKNPPSVTTEERPQVQADVQSDLASRYAQADQRLSERWRRGRGRGRGGS